MGISNDTQFASQILNCLDSKGIGKITLSLDNYISFWNGLNSKNSAYNYALGLLSKLQYFEEFKKNNRRNDLNDIDNIYKSVGLTLLYLNYFNDLASDDTKFGFQVSQWLNDRNSSEYSKVYII